MLGAPSVEMRSCLKWDGRQSGEEEVQMRGVDGLRRPGCGCERGCGCGRGRGRGLR